MLHVHLKLSVIFAPLILAAPAMAAELTGAEIKELTTGKTIYIETTANSAAGKAGQGTIYFATDGTVLYKTPTGAMWHGNAAFKDNAQCANWKEAPDAPCSKYDKQGETISIINANTGQLRARIVKIAAGNAENLVP